MAIRQPVVTPVIGYGNIDGYQVVWAGLLNGDTGAPVGSTIGFQAATAVVAQGGGDISGFADKSFAVAGTFGVSGACAIEGSNDGVSFFTMNDSFGVALSVTTASVRAATEAVIQARPHVTAGDGTTNLTVTAFFRKTQQP